MLAAILIGFYSLVLLVLYGAGFLALAAVILRSPFQQPPPTLTECALAGFIPLIWLTSLFSIFLPLNQSTALYLFLGAAILFFWIYRSRRNWLTAWLENIRGITPLVWIPTALGIFTTIVLSTLKPNNADTGLYHAQAIRWIETFSVVPGLGNYHSRLAFNSNWFPLQAAFSFAFLELRSFHLMGAVLNVVSLVYFAGGLRGLLQRQFLLSHWMRLLFLPLTFFILASEISSTGTDLPVTLITWVLLSLWLELLEKPHTEMTWQKILLIFLPVCLITIKLSAFPLLLIPAWLLIPTLKGKDGFYRLAITAVLSLVLWAPWLVRNVIVSGYLVYPPMGIDIFNFEWKIPPQAAKAEAEWITSWARISLQDKDVILAMPVTQWAPMWFDELTVNRQYIIRALIAAPFAFAILAAGGIAFLRKRMIDYLKPFRVSWPVWLVTYLGIVFWFLSVPRFRFGNGVIMAGMVLIAICGIGIFRKIRIPAGKFVPHLAAVMIGVYFVFVLAVSADMKTISSRMNLPANYVNLPTAPCEFGNFGTACATQYMHCGYNPFPCSWQGIPNVYMRGRSFGDGFVTK